MELEDVCAFCNAHFSYERTEMRGGKRISCDVCKRQAWKRYRSRNVEKERARKQAWRDRKRAEAGIVRLPRVPGVVRREVSLGLRFAILQRDGFKCQYCGRGVPDVELHVDHVTPVSLGGDNRPDNLTTACTDCNFGKQDVPLRLVS